jgi:superoxide dismutase
VDLELVQRFLRPLWKNFTGLFNAMETVAMKFRRMEQDSNRIDELEAEIKNANQTVLNHKATIDSLNRRSQNQSEDGSLTENVPRSELVEVIPLLARKQLSLARF